MRVYDTPFSIQRQNEATEAWEDVFKLHGRINKKTGDTPQEYGAERYSRTLTFETRWFNGLEELGGNPSGYRIMYRGSAYDIVDYDDFMEQHKNVTLTARGCD